MIELVVCDMAGTTVNEHGDVYRALQEAVEATGVQVAEGDLQDWMGAEKRHAIDALIRLGGGTPTPAMLDEAFADFRDRLDTAYTKHAPESLPGVEDALHRLRRAGIKVALTTGFTRDVADMVLAALEWTVGDGGLLDAVVASDEAAAGRPAPYMIHRVMEMTGVQDVRRIAAVGDTAIDLAAARNAGVLALGVLTGKLDRATMEQYPHDAVLDGVAELPGYLGLATIDRVPSSA